MSSFITNLKLPAIISSILVAPFMVLEFVNRRHFHESFPVPLLSLLWLLPVVFVLILRPVVRNVRAGKGIKAYPISFLLAVIFLVLTAWIWVGTILDQMPCFLGIPNCD
jgi:hypothetical protein